MRKSARFLVSLVVALFSVFAVSTAVWAGFAGDLNGDVQVDFEDLRILCEQWLSEASGTTEGLVSYWQFNEVEGSIASDSVGGNHSQVYGAQWTDGAVEGALKFDGDGDYVDIPDFSLTANWTISAWVRSENSLKWMRGSMVWGTNSDNNNYFYVIPNVRLAFKNDTSTEVTWTGDTNFLEVWRFVTLVGRTSAVELFIDGVSQGSRSIAPTLKFYSIGTGLTDPTYNFKGDIDDVRFYNRALSAAEVLDLAQSSAMPADLNNSSTVDMVDFAIFAQDWLKKGKAIVINEFMASNKNTAADPQGEYEDWIELYNASAFPIDVGGMYVTDNLSTWNKWQIPTGHSEQTTIAPGGYLVLWADEEPADGPTHINFKLGASGEEVGLFLADGNAIDSIVFGEQLEDMSYGRFPDGDEVFRYFGYPTPGAPNNGGYLDLVGEVEFSHNHGYYKTAFSLALRCDTPNVVIRYTTNGSEPVDGISPIYSAPINISTTTCIRARAFKEGCLPSEVYTNTYIFTAAVLTQSRPAGWPTAWGGGYPADYEMDPEVYNNSAYSGQMNEALLSIPTMSIVTSPENFWDSETGIYMNTIPDGEEWERPVSVEFFDPCGTDEFQINCGIRISGNASRVPEKNPKHAFRLLFKGIYGPTKLKYPLFGPDGADEFETIVIRTEFCNAWQHWAQDQRLRAQSIRDQWGRHAQLAMGQMSCRGRYAHLYINGIYWGLYYPSERPSGGFWAEYEGGSKEDYDTLKVDEAVTENNGIRAIDGDLTAWNAMQALLTMDMSNNTNYQRLLGNNPDGTPNLNFEKYLDAENLIDYMLLNIYGGNDDWDHHNVWMGKSRTERTGFRFFCWDVEHIIKPPSPVMPINENNPYRPSAIYATLRQNAEFRMLFADRVYKHLFNGGALYVDAANPGWDAAHPERNKPAALWMSFANQIDKAIIAESARWGDYRRDVHRYQTSPYYLYTKNDHWLPQQTLILTNFFPTRNTTLLDYLDNNQSGYPGLLYPITDPPEFYIGGVLQHGGYANPPSNVLTMVNPNGAGTIYYTLDGSDPRLIGGAVSADASNYGSTGPVVLTRSTQVKARVLNGSEWSALHDATYAVGPVAENLRITEIMYHPANPDPCGLYTDDDFEYVELVNTGSTTIDLACAGFTKGIDYKFGASGGQSQVTVENINFISHQHVWKYNSSGSNLGTAWREVGYNDSSWPSGAALLYRESATMPAPWVKNTEFNPYNSNIITYYFRTTFNLAADPTVSQITLQSNALIDDGAVIYINGAEALRIRMPVGTINFNTGASTTVGDAINYVYAIPSSSLVQGQNVIAVEVHQPGTGSGDVVFGLTLDASIITTTPPTEPTDTELAAGESIVVVKNPDAFMERYPYVPEEKIFGPYTGSLDKAGEKIKLIDAAGTTILEFKYKDTWRDITDGDGYSLTIIDAHNSDTNSWAKKDSWRASAFVGGSPAYDDDGIIPNPGSIVINEILAHSHATALDWIELRNTTGSAINIGGWFLSDDSNNLTKYQIPPSTTIPANGYLVFTQNTHFGFALSENGEEVCLTSYMDSNSNLTGYRQREDFGASATDVTLGRYYRTSTDSYNFVAMASPTQGYANSGPKIGPVVISEIMYHPEFLHPDAEYIELKNISGLPVTFAIGGVPWKITDGIDFTFPVGAVLPAGGYMLLVKDLAAFQARFSPPPTVTVLQWSSGSLNNGGEKVELSMPGDLSGGVRYYIRVDRVEYSDGSHPENCPGDVDTWPVTADGGGKSLTKTNAALYGNDVANWTAANPTPGQ